MERKIGEVFEFEGRKYKVVERVNKHDLYCDRCAFDIESGCLGSSRGWCSLKWRQDEKDVIFVEVKE